MSEWVDLASLRYLLNLGDHTQTGKSDAKTVTWSSVFAQHSAGKNCKHLTQTDASEVVFPHLNFKQSN